MNTKKMTVNAILIAIGVILHIAAPSIGLPAQPDFAVAMLFIIMLLNRDYKTTIISGIIIGIFTAVTTKTAGGQLPNILDKLITCNVMYLVLLPLRNKVSKNIQAVVILLLGTMISGFSFLSTLAIIYGIEGTITAAIIAVVIPTAAINTVVGLIMYKIIERTIKQTRIKLD
ncbi:Tryptophan transporter TrpP [Clostridium sp. DSM 8431]|uniref:tryptophan transporter n=1 Tax=Clostridium sp. DSM 8431 TaxID=1761781 RepID=UPI0008EFE466|nr:tryptophan transporter [Clostridium sp. DSM 8431]SFU71810.1 Tryptophan transporter TrpP [Clostridium sp. DSM 8431]